MTAQVLQFPVIQRKPADQYEGLVTYQCLRMRCCKKTIFGVERLRQIFARNHHNVIACDCGAEMRPVEK